MSFNEEVDKIIMENFDLSDGETLDVITSVNEADKTQLLLSLTSRLYDNIVDKVNDIDFGTIPESKGDITQIENYDKMCECVNIMIQLISEYKQDPKPIRTILDALDNLKDRKKLFERAYTFNVELPIVIYNTIALSSVSSISYLIASCIEFIKNADSDEYNIALDKVAYRRSRDALLLKNLETFNRTCDNKSFDKAMEDVISANKSQLTGASVLGVATLIVSIPALIKIIIPCIQECVYFLFHTRQTLSDYFSIQADLLQINANSLQYKNIEDDRKNDIYKKQMGIVSVFRNISSKFDIDRKKSETNAANSIQSDKRKYKVSDISADIPDSATVEPTSQPSLF